MINWTPAAAPVGLQPLRFDRIRCTPRPPHTLSQQRTFQCAAIYRIIINRRYHNVDVYDKSTGTYTVQQEVYTVADPGLENGAGEVERRRRNDRGADFV